MENGDGLFECCILRGLGERSLARGSIATGDGKVYAMESCLGISAGASWAVTADGRDGADGAFWSFREVGTGITGIGEDNGVGVVTLLDSGSGTGVDSLIVTGGGGTTVIVGFIGVEVFSGKYPGPGTADLTWGAA
jgi:hypothetical protein